MNKPYVRDAMITSVEVRFVNASGQEVWVDCDPIGTVLGARTEDGFSYWLCNEEREACSRVVEAQMIKDRR